MSKNSFFDPSLSKRYETRCLMALLEQMPEGITLTDEGGKILYVNKAECQMTGYRSEELVGKSIAIFYSKKKNPPGSWKKVLRDTKNGGYEGEFWNVAKDGSPYPIWLKTSKIRDKDGKTIALVGIAKDITEYLKTRKIKELEITHLERKVTHIEKKLFGLLDISNALSSELSLQDFLKQIVKTACTIINASAASIRFLHPEDNKLNFAVGYKISKAYLDKTPLYVGEGVPGYVAFHKKPLAISDIEKSNQVKYKDILIKKGIKSILGVPIFYKKELKGSIVIYDKNKRIFKKDEISLLSAFASQAAILIEDARLFGKIRTSYLDTIHALAMALEAKDPYTHGHAERVTRYAIAIAKHMGLPEEKIETMRTCGLVHDIGKIGISDLILRKAGPLSPAERIEIERHPSNGAEMLSPLKMFENGLDMVRYHHERFDGDGYPAGIKGNVIPVEARILAVADAFDAMTSERPYRSALSTEQAIKELIDNKSTQFDPRIVDIFLKTLNKEQSKSQKLFSLE